MSVIEAAPFMVGRGGTDREGRDRNDLGTRYSFQDYAFFSTYTSFPSFHALSVPPSQLLATHLTEKPTGHFRFSPQQGPEKLSIEKVNREE